MIRVIRRLNAGLWWQRALGVLLTLALEVVFLVWCAFVAWLYIFRRVPWHHG